MGIPISTNCASLIEDFILFCSERNIISSLPDNTLADVLEADVIDLFNSTTILYLDAIT